MKKIVLAAIVAVAGAWGVYQANQNNNAQLSDLQMENLEALADGEDIENTDRICKQDPSKVCELIIIKDKYGKIVKTQVIQGERQKK